jgi:hypothetical protein
LMEILQEWTNISTGEAPTDARHCWNSRSSIARGELDFHSWSWFNRKLPITLRSFTQCNSKSFESIDRACVNARIFAGLPCAIEVSTHWEGFIAGKIVESGLKNVLKMVFTTDFSWRPASRQISWRCQDGSLGVADFNLRRLASAVRRERI